MQLDERTKRELLNTAASTQTYRTRTTDKTIPSFEMHKASVKYTIFETMQGANERRFVPFNDMPHGNSKYAREQIGILDFTNVEGREKITKLNPEPHEMMPDYRPNKEYVSKNLRKGAIKFGSMSARKPNLNQTYWQQHTFYTQQGNTAQIEHRPRINRVVEEAMSDANLLQEANTADVTLTRGTTQSKQGDAFLSAGTSALSKSAGGQSTRK